MNDLFFECLKILFLICGGLIALCEIIKAIIEMKGPNKKIDLENDKVFKKQIKSELYHPHDTYEIVGYSHVFGRCCGQPSVKVALFFVNISPNGQKIKRRRYNYYRYYCQTCGSIINYGRASVGM